MRAGCLCLRAGRNGPEALLIRTSSGKRTTIPKGSVESPEAPLAAARRELLEEAGHEAKLDPRPVLWGAWRGEQLVVFLGRNARPVQPAEPRRNPEWVPVSAARRRLMEQRSQAEASFFRHLMIETMKRFDPQFLFPAEEE